MLTKLIALTAALSVAESYLPPVVDWYNSMDGRNLLPDQQLPVLHLYLAEGQCSGRINKDLLCDKFLPLGLTVNLTDIHGFPLIHVADDLGNIDLARIPNEDGLCPEKVKIALKLSCNGNYVPTDNHVVVPVLK